MEGDVSGVPVDDVEEPQRDPICGMSFINYPRNITGGKRNYSNGSLTRASHSSDSNCYKNRALVPTHNSAGLPFWKDVDDVGGGQRLICICISPGEQDRAGNVLASKKRLCWACGIILQSEVECFVRRWNVGQEEIQYPI